MIQMPLQKPTVITLSSAGCTHTEIEHTQVVVKKKNRRGEGSKQFTSNYTAATEVLKPGFGVVKICSEEQ